MQTLLQKAENVDMRRKWRAMEIVESVKK
jgi:hypothetical protein